MLHDLLDSKKYFLVLDDVWEEDREKWSQFFKLLTVGKAGSIILITTRGNHVASMTGTIKPYNLESLPVEVCWLIFKQLAFSEGEEEIYRDLVEIGRLIVEKCNGIPLVVKSLGSMLRSERDKQQWKKIEAMDSFVGLRRQYEKVMSLLKLSYNKLPSHLKPCFAYFSLFLKDAPLYSAEVIYWWRALGLLQGEDDIESIGYSYFSELLSRSLLHEPNLELHNSYFFRCKMHDMMHDLSTNILKEELSIVTQDKIEVSECTRHLIWEYNGSNFLEDTTFLKELSNAPNIRSFKFGYQMNDVSRSFLERIISNFSYLRILDISESQFQELPKMIGNLKHVRFLDLFYNTEIKWLPNSICKLLNLETFFLLGCVQLQKIPDDICLLQNLRTFRVTTCEISLGTKFNELSSLRFLEFGYCEKLTSMWEDYDVRFLTSLRFLYIATCPKLTYLPKSIRFLRSLESLIIEDCEMLDFENDGESSLEGLQSLKQLFIVGIPKLVRLPHGFQSIASLQDLFIADCKGLTELPNFLKCYTSLLRVSILKCPNILSLPRSFWLLKSMQQLTIQDCPRLSERCVVPDGADYHLIRHIPEYILDGVAYASSPNPAYPYYIREDCIFTGDIGDTIARDIGDTIPPEAVAHW